MLRDITLGQYFLGNSTLHKSDPRVKLIVSLLFMIELFIANEVIGFGICFVATAIAVKVARVPIKYILKGLKPIFAILLFTIVLNMFMTPGTIIFKVGFLKLTYEGLRMAALMATRIVLLIVSSSLLTLTTKPIELTDGIESLLNPLRVIKVPAHEIAMMMSIALRFIPTLLEEADKIIKAQQARGADFESGNILRRTKAMLPILVPLFVSAIRIAQDLAMAMEARCYRGGEGRTRVKEMKMEGRDWVLLAISFIILGIVIALRIWRGEIYGLLGL